MKCVYCNKTEGLTSSDIISYGLTGAKLKKSFVCKEHNAFTNDNYEKHFIANLDFYRNCLGLKTRAGEEIKYRADVSVGKNKIENVKLSDREAFFDPKGIISGKSIDGSKILFGPIDKLTKTVPPEEASKIDLIDISDVTVHKKVSADDFADYYAVHSIAKIAYEWHCYINGIEKYQDTYQEIVNYILSGEGSNIVEIVTDADYYYTIDKLSEVGTNSVFEYDDPDGYRYVIFDLWKTIAYKVRIRDSSADCKTTVANGTHFFEVFMYYLDGSEGKTAFGMLDGGSNSLFKAYRPEDIDASIWRYFANRSLKLQSTTNLSILSIKKEIDLLEKDLINYENGKIEFARLIKYEDEKRVIAIEVINQLYENISDYKTDKSFNINLAHALNTDDDWIFLSKESKKEIISRWLELDSANQFGEYLHIRITAFNSIYESEMKREGYK